MPPALLIPRDELTIPDRGAAGLTELLRKVTQEEQSLAPLGLKCASDFAHTASIVHEATHARVARWCGTRPPEHRAQEERLRRRAELAFGLAVPNGARVVQRAMDSLALEAQDVAPTVDWQEAARRIAQVDAAQRRSVRRAMLASPHYALRPPSSTSDSEAYHAIRRDVLFKRRGHFGTTTPSSGRIPSRPSAAGAAG